MAKRMTAYGCLEHSKSSPDERHDEAFVIDGEPEVLFPIWRQLLKA
jgi:hypothetical protein